MATNLGWERKGVKIAIGADGLFHFTIGNEHYSKRSLMDAYNKIDELKKNYYTFTENDWCELLKKLNSREREFLISMKKAFLEHAGNAYCQLGCEIKNWEW